MKTLLVVAAALVNERGEVLLAQRPPGKRLAGKWEFPGGKVESHESPEEALIREIGEELDVVISPDGIEPFWFLSHDYTGDFSFHLLMPVYLIRRWQGEPRAVEHSAIKWVLPRDMGGMDMIEADADLVSRLKAHL